MENKDKIEIIKEILYEESTRKMLTSQRDAVVSSDTGVKSPQIWKWLAAACVIALLSIIGLNYIGGATVDKDALIAEVYDFPAINKSRGAIVNIVDDYIPEISAGKYKEVLASFPEESLSEKDQFYKACMYFAIGEYDKAKRIISKVTWADTYYKEETDWLNFLIAYHDGDDSLLELRGLLNANYTRKAEELLSKN